MLGGTHMTVAAHAHLDPLDLQDESWQPTKLQLEARLGASRERQLELEWRLQKAQGQVNVVTLGDTKTDMIGEGARLARLCTSNPKS